MSCVAIIPARGGTKRLPRKNILPIDGVPMIAHPIRIARESLLFDEVIVSTEDPEIAEIASTYGAVISHRPQDLASDRSTIAQVCYDVLDCQSPEATMFCCLYATAVLVSVTTLRSSYGDFSGDPMVDYLMGVSNYEFPPVQALTTNDDGFLSYMWPEFVGVQSQYHPELVVSNGTFIWARTDAFKRERLFYGNRLRGHLVPKSEVSDIDTLEDYEALIHRLDES